MAKQVTVATGTATQRIVAQRLQHWAWGQRRAAVLGHGLALQPVVATPSGPTVRRKAKAAKRFAKLGRLRPSRVGRRGRVVAGAMLPALTYNASIRGVPPSLDKTSMKWEHAFAGLLPRAVLVASLLR